MQLKRTAFATCVSLMLCVPAFAQQGDQPARPSIAELQRFADAGNPEALARLAKRYAEGDGVLPDYAKAVELFQLAAEQGHAEAQNQLARHVHAGFGTVSDPAKALEWMEKAASQGNARHIFDYAALLEETASDPDQLTKAVEAYQRAGEAGHVPAVTSLGVLYQSGTGVEQDFGAALTLFEQAAKAGDLRAMNNLGLLYVRGDGVDQDYERAAKFFEAAASSGLRKAMGNLAVMYENGFGVPQDDAQHAYWLKQSQAGQQSDEVPGGFTFDPLLVQVQQPDFPAAVRKAAQAGDPVAQFQLGWWLLNSEGASFATASEARFWFEQAALRGHGAAMANLGQMYARGFTLPQDYLRAYAWLSTAVAAGRDDQIGALNWMAARMPQTQLQAAQEHAKSLWTPAPEIANAGPAQR